MNFDAWVADAVEAVSGIRPKRLCGLQEKRLLTCVESGAVACQEVSARYFDAEIQASMRKSAVVLTNVVSLDSKRR